MLSDDAGYCTRAQHPLLVDLATMRMGDTQAQLAPSRDYQSIRKAAQGIGRACEPLLGPLPLEHSEKSGEVITCHGNGGELGAE